MDLLSAEVKIIFVAGNMQNLCESICLNALNGFDVAIFSVRTDVENAYF